MAELRDLIKRSFDAFVKMRWIKEIEKATNECRKAKNKYTRKWYVLDALLKAYEEKYGEDLMGEKYG